MNLYQQQARTFRNELRQSCGALIGIVQGMLADQELNDREISFLQDWLQSSESLNMIWPCSVIGAQVRQVLADGVVTDEERAHLTDTLLKLIGGTLDELADAGHVSRLPLDDLLEIEITGRQFCFTGDFAFGPRSSCEAAVARRGGFVISSVTKKLHYLVVGGLGSAEWKHGSFGTKVEKAIEYRQAGVPLRIVHEDVWASSLRG